ncbi:MAG: hypothetical protein HJHJAOHD_02508 [Flavobacteriales bacterium]|nr:hypothetical protein [Flavobacteriales bacterium]
MGLNFVFLVIKYSGGGYTTMQYERKQIKELVIKMKRNLLPTN